jgi:hypothetical protein
MRFDTAFNCGDKGWTFTGSHVVQRTIGQIRVEYTHSGGIGDGFMEGGVIANGGENYAPMPPELIETCMCVETGIGSGQVFTLGESIFTTEEGCRTACAKAIQRRAEEEAAAARWKREEALREEAGLRRRLAEIERLKAAA